MPPQSGATPGSAALTSAQDIDDRLYCPRNSGVGSSRQLQLWQHLAEILETFVLTLVHGGRLATMPPKLLNEDGDLFLYRPLAFVAEADCEAFASAMNYPIIPCDLCGSQEGLQRQQIKQILDDWEARTPGRRQVMFRALTNTRPSHLLDTDLFDFAGLIRAPVPAGTKSDNPPDIQGSD